MATCSVNRCPSELSLNNIQEKRCLLPCESIDYLQDLISYEEFFLRYLIPNKPCILSSPQITQLWKCRNEWVTHKGTPNFEFLEKTFGKVSVPVAICDKEEFCSHPKIQKNFADFLDYWQKYISSSYPKSMQCLYLKDWHFTRDFPEYIAYTTPVYFQSDWLNEFWDSQENQDDDYRFVYMGPKGSWTSFHADVFHSYSWSANICGQKRWLLFPPGQENHLRDKFGQLPFDVTSSDLLNPAVYPSYYKLTKQYEVIQNPGEILFVPSGWYHQVWNMQDTISINHNWLNGCCIDLNWRFLQKNLGDVQKEISDCREMEGWHQQCQVILKSLTGINYEEFFNLCKTIAESRFQLLKKSRYTHTSDASKDKNMPSFKLEKECQFPKDVGQSNILANHFMPIKSNYCHQKFDLHKLKDILTEILKDETLEIKSQVDKCLKNIQVLEA